MALAGAVAGLAGIAVSHVTTNILNARATPIQAVAETIIVITPGGLAEALIQLVGDKDKPILIAGVTVAIILFGALAGVLSRRSRLAANLVFLGMGAVALVALMSRPGFSANAALPLAVGVGTWLIVFGILADSAAGVVSTSSTSGTDSTSGVSSTSGTDSTSGTARPAGRARPAMTARPAVGGGGGSW